MKFKKYCLQSFIYNAMGGKINNLNDWTRLGVYFLHISIYSENTYHEVSILVQNNFWRDTVSLQYLQIEKMGKWREGPGFNAHNRRPRSAEISVVINIKHLTLHNRKEMSSNYAVFQTTDHFMPTKAQGRLWTYHFSCNDLARLLTIRKKFD